MITASPGILSRSLAIALLVSPACGQLTTKRALELQKNRAMAVAKSPASIPSLRQPLAFARGGGMQACNNLITAPTINDFAHSSETTNAPACTLTDGMYLKAGATFRIDVWGEVDGACQVRAFGGWPPACSNVGQPELRSIYGAWVTEEPPAGGEYNYPTWPNCGVTGCTRVIDTRPTGGTTPDQFEETPSDLGTYNYKMSLSITPTSCNLTPTALFAPELNINVMGCKPIWNMLLGANLHAPPGDIYIYIPPGMWNQLHSPAEQAVADWNTALNGVVTFHVQSNDCSGSTGNCLRYREDNNYAGCGAIDGPSVWDHTTGEVQSDRYLDLPTSPSWRDWRTRSADRLKRSVAHELGHALGLGDYEVACALAESLMAPIPGTLPDSDKCTTTTNMALSATPNDTKPVTQSTFGNGVRGICGF